MSYKQCPFCGEKRVSGAAVSRPLDHLVIRQTTNLQVNKISRFHEEEI